MSLVKLTPALNIYEKDNDIIAEVPLYGVEPKDIKVSVKDNILIVQGQMEKKSEVEEKNYYRHEVSFGSFYREVALPAEVDGNQIKTDYQEGILRISLPKRKASR